MDGKELNRIRIGDMNFLISDPKGKDDLNYYYNGMFEQEPPGTLVDRIEQTLMYENTGNSGTVRVNARDLRQILKEYKDISADYNKRRRDHDLRSDPEIVNIPEGPEKERRIIEKMNFKEALK